MKKLVCMIGIIGMLVFTAGVAYAQTADESPVQSEESLIPPEEGPPAPVQPAAPYKNFNAGQRWGTFLLNYFTIPGIGSYALMQDTVGGTIQLAAYGVSTGLVIGGLAVWYKMYVDFARKSAEKIRNTQDSMDQYYLYGFYGETNNHNVEDDDTIFSIFDDSFDDDRVNLVIGLFIAAGIISTGNLVFNIVRSFTYDKPQPNARIGSLADPNAWSFAILPGKNGVEAVQLAYTYRY